MRPALSLAAQAVVRCIGPSSVLPSGNVSTMLGPLLAPAPVLAVLQVRTGGRMLDVTRVEVQARSVSGTLSHGRPPPVCAQRRRRGPRRFESWIVGHSGR